MTPGSSWRPPPASASDASLLDTDGALRETIDRAAAPPSYRPAPRTLGRYVLLALIGEGGMGQVYRAYDPELDRMIAIKRLRVDDRDAPIRLQREAQAIAKLSHPNVVAVHDVGRDEPTGDLFIAMELVDGQTLQTWLFARSRSWKEIARVFAQAGRGLAAAHRVGLLHRDFKPHNVLVTSRGRAKVVDFGLAKPMGDDDGDAPTAGESRRTPTDPAPDGPPQREATPFGARLGTPAYMPPEAILGQEVDPRGDQFSFAVALYEAFCGSLPFSGKNAAEHSVAVLDGRLEPWPRGTAVPRRLQRAILRALARKPADRHPDLAPLIAELEREPRRLEIAALGGALLLGGALATLGVALQRDDVESRCRAAGERLPSWWEGDPRRRTHEALAAIAPPLGVETAERTVAALDELVAAWSEARFDACMSAPPSASEPADTRSMCLDREASRIEELVAALGDASSAVLEHAVPAVETARRELERCREPAGLSRFDRLRRADEQGLARTAMETARGHLALHEIEAGLATLASLDVERLDGAVAFEVELLRARLHHGAGDLGAAEEAYVRASHLGLGHADPVAAAEWHECWGDLAYATGRLADMDAAYARAEQLFAAELGRGSPETIVAHATRGHEAYATGDYVHALERYAEAARAMQTAVRDTHPLRMLVDGWVAQTEGHLGRLADARAQSEDLATRLAAAYGPSHPQTLSATYELAVLELRAGDAAAALGRFEHVLSTRRALGHTDAIDLAACEANIGGALLELHREAEGIERLERALSTLEGAGLPATHAQILAARANLGIALRQTRRSEEAEPVLTAVLRDMERAGMEDTANALGVRLHLGRIHLDAGRSDDARAFLLDAVQAADRSGDRVMAGRLRIELARALDALDRRIDADRVLAEARDDLRDPGASAYLRALEAFASKR